MPNKGQFTKGNPGGPGNPFARQVAHIRRSLLAAMTPEVLAAVVSRLIEHAVEGNLAAIKVLLSYTIGRPGNAENLISQLSEQFSDDDTPPAPVPCRQQTDASRQQTAVPPESARPQTAPSAAPPGKPSRHQTASAARTLTAALAGDRHQTDDSALLLSILQECTDAARSSASPPAAPRPASDISLIS